MAKRSKIESILRAKIKPMIDSNKDLSMGRLKRLIARKFRLTSHEVEMIIKEMRR